MVKHKKPETNDKKQVTRRDFLKDIGAIIASAVLFNSLAACSPKTTTETATATATATKTATATATTIVTTTVQSPITTQANSNIVIDHTNWDWYISQSQQVINSVATQKVFFARFHRYKHYAGLR